MATEYHHTERFPGQLEAIALFCALLIPHFCYFFRIFATIEVALPPHNYCFLPIIMKIAVYCSSRANLAPEFESVAVAAGKWIGTNRYELVYGGVNAGLMHTVAQAAHDAGAIITGIVPKRFAYRADNIVDHLVKCRDLNDRKELMIDCADAFIVLPGGLGTIDEWLSTLSILVVNNDSRRKIVVANIDGIFNSQISQINELANSPFARSEMLDMSIIADSEQEMINRLNEIQKFFVTNINSTDIL